MKFKHVLFICFIMIVIFFFGSFYFFSINQKNFFVINISNYISSICSVISLLFVIFISYYLTQKRNDERVIKEKLYKELEFIINEINNLDENLFNDKFEIKHYTLIRKKIDRSIKIIGHYANKFNYEIEFKSIKNEFESIDNIISNHIQSVDSLKNIIEDLVLHKDRIDNDYSEIFLKLFN